MEGELKNQQRTQEEGSGEELATRSLSEEEIHSAEQPRPFETLDKVTERARQLEGYMNEREGFTRQLFTPVQAEAFRHSFEMASESIRAGDVEGFNQELRSLDSCFDGYGEVVGEGMYDDLDSLRNIKTEFGNLKNNFDTFAGQVEELPGVDLDRLDYMRARFEQIDDFHSKLHTAVAKFLGNEEGKPGLQEASSDVVSESEIETPEKEQNYESNEHFVRMLEELSHEARRVKGKLQQRYDDRLSHQLMTPQKAGAMVVSLEAAAAAVRTGDEGALSDAFNRFSSSFNGYGDERDFSNGTRENKDNLGATVHTFSQLIEGFSRFASLYIQENPNSELAPRLQRIKSGLARVDDFNLRLKGMVSRI